MIPLLVQLDIQSTAANYSILFGLGDINETTGVYTAPSSADDVVVRVTDFDDTTSDAVLLIFIAGPFAYSGEKNHLFRK